MRQPLNAKYLQLGSDPPDCLTAASPGPSTMRGSPLLQCLIGALGFGLFAIPLVQLTFARAAVAPTTRTAPAAAAASDARHTFIRLRFAHPPKFCSLKLGGVELMPQSAVPPGSPIETEARLAIPSGGIDLALTAQWPGGTPDTAVTVELEPDELDARRETRWSTGPALTEILSFKW